MTLMEPEAETLRDFTTDPTRYAEKLRSTGLPMLLTEEGKEDLVVLNATAFQQYREAKDRLDDLAAVREGLDDLAAGRFRPMREFMEEVAAKYNFPRSPG